MRRFSSAVAVAMLLGLIPFGLINLGGAQGTENEDNENSLKTRADLEQEFGERISDSLYRAFQHAVTLHQGGQFKNAARIYRTFAEIPIPGGTFDLLACESDPTQLETCARRTPRPR